MPANSRTPYCIAAGFVRGNVGLGDFTDAAVQDPARASRSPRKVRYRIDPDNPYPNNFTGHIRATLRDGSVVEERQPHMRGGAHEPLTRADIEDKFAAQLRATAAGMTRARAGGARACAKRCTTDGSICRVEGIIEMTDRNLPGRVALVTGAGRNIGRAMAMALAAGGARSSSTCARTSAEADSVVKEIESDGGKAMPASPTWPTRPPSTPWPRPR